MNPKKRDELYRLSTFSKRSAAESTTACPFRLARCGFLYLEGNGEVACFACGRKLRGWQEVDNPRERHRQDFPDCPFITEDAAGNIPAEISASDGILGTTSRGTGVTTTDFGVDKGQHDPLDALKKVRQDAYDRARRNGVVSNDSDSQLPDSDTLRQEEERPRTSNDSSPSAQAGPEALGGAERLSPRSDDPVPLANSSVAAGGRTENESDRQIPVTSQSFAREATSVQANVEEESEARMCTPIVLEILDMGFPRYMVKSVIQHRLSTTGDDFPNAESLLEALFQMLEAPELYAMSASETGHNSSSAPSNSIHQ